MADTGPESQHGCPYAAFFTPFYDDGMRLKRYYVAFARSFPSLEVI